MLSNCLLNIYVCSHGSVLLLTLARESSLQWAAVNTKVVKDLDLCGPMNGTICEQPTLPPSPPKAQSTWWKGGWKQNKSPGMGRSLWHDTELQNEPAARTICMRTSWDQARQTPAGGRRGLWRPTLPMALVTVDGGWKRVGPLVDYPQRLCPYGQQ